MKGKKIISAALADVMALSLTACGGGSKQETIAAAAADSKAEETTAAANGKRYHPVLSAERWGRDLVRHESGSDP